MSLSVRVLTHFFLWLDRQHLVRRTVKHALLFVQIRWLRLRRRYEAHGRESKGPRVVEDDRLNAREPG